DESDLAMAMELARRISLALDNARLFSEAQERAHAAEALEYVDDGVILVDEAGIVRLWNPTAAMSLRRPAAEAVGRPIAELLEVVSSEAERLARIVNDILWASRLESGRMSIAIERCDAAAITAEVVDVLRSRAPEGIEVAVSKSRALPPIAADPDKLRQILT